MENTPMKHYGMLCVSFKYSTTGRNHQVTNPYAEFSYTPSVSKLVPGSPFYRPSRRGVDELYLVTRGAKVQFESWCSAFRRLCVDKNQSTGSNRIIVRG